jgi:hypothetical protein
MEETVEAAEDLIEDVVDIIEDLGLINESKSKMILSKVAQYKKYILIALPIIIAASVYLV